MLVAGLDEVGRGSIAGPLLVVAASFEVASWSWDGKTWDKCRAATPCPVEGVKDSKAYSSRTRRAAVAALLDAEPSLVGKGLGVVTSRDIDRYGMGKAIHRAFLRALAGLPSVPDLLLVDGDTPIKPWTGKQHARPKADRDWWPVSAASVLAKVMRDGWMVNLDRTYPGYGWSENMGYGTPAHIAALQDLGVTPIHRAQFVRSALQTKASKEDSWG